MTAFTTVELKLLLRGMGYPPRKEPAPPKNRREELERILTETLVEVQPWAKWLSGCRLTLR